MASKTRHMVKLPNYLMMHKVGARDTTVNQMLLIDEVVFELVSFIEYVGKMPKRRDIRSTEGLVAHYISYREIDFQFIRNDDALAHKTEIEGNYKIRLAFYHNMRDCDREYLRIDLDGLPVWCRPKKKQLSDTSNARKTRNNSKAKKTSKRKLSAKAVDSEEPKKKTSRRKQRNDRKRDASASSTRSHKKNPTVDDQGKFLGSKISSMPVYYPFRHLK